MKSPEERLAEVLRACEMADAIDLAQGRTQITDKTRGRGDMWSRDVRDLAEGKITADEFAKHRRESFQRAKEMVDAAYKRRRVSQ